MLVIPRGGEALIGMVTAEATMPVLKHDKGVCHAYIDETADLDSAIKIIYNSKVQRPSACNSLEGLLVHKAQAQALLPKLAEILGEAGVIFHACPQALPLIQGKAKVEALKEEEKGKEYLALEMTVMVVDSLQEAMNYIAVHGSNHSELICTNNHQNAMTFFARG
jgi:glutamate-5-semialdehyde dehydrogenase (EC 1.2.1.41)